MANLCLLAIEYSIECQQIDQEEKATRDDVIAQRDAADGKSKLSDGRHEDCKNRQGLEADAFSGVIV